MGIRTGRAEGTAKITLDAESCIGCGLCVKVCKGAPLYMEDGKIQVDQSRYFGCIGCGHCVAVCPQDCITVDGRDLYPDDIIDLPAGEPLLYDSLKSLMVKRRSVREFQSRRVERELIDKLVATASTAPMGLPPSDVEILVFDGQDKVREFSDDLIEFMKGIKWILSPTMRMLMRPFMGKEANETFATFLSPALDMFLEKQAAGDDWLTYGAPLGMYFHTSPYADPVDPLIPATYAMLAAESLGLGSCMLGIPAYCLRYSRKLRHKYGVGDKNQQGILVVFGYPAVKYQKAIQRRLAKVNFY